MSDQTPANVNVRLALEQSALQQSTQGVDKLKQQFIDLKSQAQQSGSSADGALKGMVGDASDATRQVKELNSALESTSKTAEKVKASGNNFSNVGTFRRAVGAAGNLGIPQELIRPLQIAGDFGQIGKALEKFGLSLDKLPGLFGAVAAQGEALAGGFGAILAVAAPLLIVVGGVAVGLKLYNDSLQASTKALGDARVALDTYYKAIQNGTTEGTQKQLDALKAQKANIDAETKNIQEALNKGFESAKKQFGGDLGGRLATAGISATNEEFRKLGDRLNELKKQSGDLDGQIQGLTTALGSAAVKANDLAEEMLKEADKTAESQINQYKLIREGTTKQLQGIIDDNKDKVQAYTAELAALNSIKAPNDDVKNRIKELNGMIADLSTQSAELTQNVLPLVKAREAEAESLKKLNAEVQAAQKASQERASKEVDIVKKMDDQINSAEENAAQERIAISDKLHDALVKAAEDALEASQKALDKLTQTRDKNLTDLDRDLSKMDRQAAATELEDRVSAQRQERDDLQAHLDNLKQIRDRDASRERDDLLNRNYRDLFALKEQKTQDINAENDKFAAQTAQREQALADQFSDQKRADQQQRQERIIAYNQANADAVRAYNIELAQAQAAKQKAIELAQQANHKELTELNSATNQKLKLIRDSALSELKIITQTKQAEQQIFQSYLNRAQQMLGQVASGSSGGAFNSPGRIASATSFAYGGSVASGQWAQYNDRYPGQSESFNGFRLPGGRGLLFPEQPGSINSAQSTNTSHVYNNTFHIMSNDPVGVRQEVIKVIREIKR